MATKLKNMKIREISLVDRPANKLARIVLAKRDFSDEEKRGAVAQTEGDDWRGGKLRKLMDWVEKHPWMQDRFEIEFNAICGKIDKPKR